jgi:serine/threonine protein kinase
MKQCPSCGFENDDNLRFCNECGTSLSAGADPFVGTVIDRRYEVVGKVAEGGMGSVYRAKDLRLKKDAALKILHPELARDKKLTARFENEAVTVARLKHPNIVQVYDTGPVRGTYYIAMDFVDGTDLVDIIKKRGRLPVDEACEIASRVADGLAYAHAEGILHRDVKPANIIIDKKGRVLITDFGIAKALGEKGQTTTGTAVGTPEYMSVEQLKGMELDGRTDVYSLGVVLYEMLTGRSPFRSDTAIAAVSRALTEEPEPIGRLRPDLPGWAVGVVERAMEKDRGRRYDSAAELAGDLGERDAGPRAGATRATSPREDEPAREYPRTERVSSADRPAAIGAGRAAGKPIFKIVGMPIYKHDMYLGLSFLAVGLSLIVLPEMGIRVPYDSLVPLLPALPAIVYFWRIKNPRRSFLLGLLFTFLLLVPAALYSFIPVRVSYLGVLLILTISGGLLGRLIGFISIGYDRFRRVARER